MTSSSLRNDESILDDEKIHYSYLQDLPAWPWRATMKSDGTGYHSCH
jgi:hypothetical protein